MISIQEVYMYMHLHAFVYMHLHNVYINFTYMNVHTFTASPTAIINTEQSAVTTTITLTETLVAQCSADEHSMAGPSEAGFSTTDPAFDHFTVTSGVTVTSTPFESNLYGAPCAQSTLMVTHTVSVMETCMLPGYIT